MKKPRSRCPSSRSRAFSIAEVTVVLVILALLVGGVVTGRSLIRSAELNSIMSDANAYVTAVGQFRDQYRALPGDMGNAASYWASPIISGNADGVIAGDERFQVWAQLQQAAFIEGSYTGATGGGGANDFVLGSNIPKSRIPLSGFSAYYANRGATATTYAVNLGNMIAYGKQVGVDAGEPINAILTPTDARAIDKKADDGVPGTGKWIANLTGAGNFGAANACTTDANGSVYAGDYQMTIEDVACSFFIMTGY